MTKRDVWLTVLDFAVAAHLKTSTWIQIEPVDLIPPDNEDSIQASFAVLLLAFGFRSVSLK
ncbi:hypothetical protein URS_1281 [Acinetobacter ursingii]|nr:hypothetical protein URS_1281 [Acinetobacter ursingii]